ncbi:Methyltransferase domain-containing protein [Cruoricaptor ignavus]|uniref:Methyltransferase domain-containing protein n=1 Tax=Cruoricaptor ignavus TaxID=1118202 RepID=A0A1M6BXN3_9FLAO|nr:class I SAM-dependent methyltransferase [Cruoricaptor ignavus]SHI53457.1 Methyltransferase domain-containing protein [Cruoricaptor ignavus]
MKTDLPGIAIRDFYENNLQSELFVHDKFGVPTEMPVEIYFRKFDEMPEIEQKALELCSGKILDVGAGAGSHALHLQENSADVSALEISPNSCEVMRRRGVRNVLCEDFFRINPTEKFGTILLLMNGIGICGDLEGFRKFLQKAESLLERGGKILFDSCDILYMYETAPLPTHYYGQASVRYEYAAQFTDWFSWLYIDKKMMSHIAEKCGWKPEIILEDGNFQYLASLVRK